MKLGCITVTKLLRWFRTSGCRKWMNRFKNKKFVFWAEYFEQHKIAADIEEKSTNEGEVIRGGISRIYLSLSNKLKPCHRPINSRPSNLRTALEKYIWFQWNCKQLQIEARNSMANWQMYFPICSDTVHPQHDLRKVW